MLPSLLEGLERVQAGHHWGSWAEGMALSGALLGFLLFEVLRSCLVWIRSWSLAGFWLVLCPVPRAKELLPLPGIPWKSLWLLVAPEQQFCLAFPGI